MGQANLLGGAGGGGLREKPITQAAYNALSTAERNNPYVIWVITDADKNAIGTVNVNAANVSNLKTKATVWSTYQSLSDDDRNDPSVQWIITDKNQSDLPSMGFGVQHLGQGSQLYNIVAELDHASLVSLVVDLVQRVDTVEDTLAAITDALKG